MTLELTLVRHGVTPWTEVRRLCGWTDVSLSATGRAQAERLSELLPAGQYVGTWCSDLLRCRETAELAGVTARPDARLREIDFGDLEGLTWDQLDDPSRAALLDLDNFSAPGGGSATEMLARLTSFLSELEPGPHLIFTHGGPIRALLRASGDADGGMIDPASFRTIRYARPR